MLHSTKALKKSTGKTLIAPRERATSVRSAGKKQKLKNFIQPMLAQLGDEPFNNAGWIFEAKWDGYRAVAEINDSGVKLYSRNGLSFNFMYPKIIASLRELGITAVLDGEIVVLNNEGKPDFQKLQRYSASDDLRYCVFDCLAIEGRSLTNLPLLQRKEMLRNLIPANHPVLVYSDHVAQNGELFFKKIAAVDLEGMIAKKSDSLYYPGKRTREWLKIKNHNTQEAIIVGYTQPRGARSYLGALILAVKQGSKFRYIGHTGTGFTVETLKDLYQRLKPLVVSHSPFSQKVPVRASVNWVEPRLVCQVKYTELTKDGILRHPVFLGLRIDKSSNEVNTIDAVAHNNTGTPKRSRNEDVTNETVSVGKREVTITNKSKIYWPEEKITKGDVINYYNTIHQFILPYLKNRPQSLRRNPNGITQPGFFQKEAGTSIPDWIKTETIYAESADRNINYIICNDLPSLLYLNNLGCIELNPWSSRVGRLDFPDYVVLDLDPSENNTFDDVIETALVMKDILDEIDCPSFCKTSGASGLHIYIPLGKGCNYEQARSFAEVIAQKTELQLPGKTTTERALKKRNGRIYLDYEQNKKGQTVASVYSLRPKPGATVSTPLKWKEVKAGLAPTDFNIHSVPKRLQKTGDLFADVLYSKINLTQCLKKLKL